MPNLKIGIEEHNFLRKIITEKYQQKDPIWSPVGNLNNYNNIAKNIRLSVKKLNDTLSVSPHQMQKLFTYHGECIYREDFIEACYLYCGLNRNANAFDSPIPSVPETLQESENRADALQKEMDHHIEQNNQLEGMLEAQKTEIEILKTQLEDKKDWIQVLDHKMIAQKEQNELLHQEITAQYEQHELLKNDLETHQNQLRALEARFVEQGKAVHHYVSLLKSYEALIEHQKTVSEGELQNLKQIIATLNDENQRLIAEKTGHKKPKKTLAKILFII